MGRTDITHPNWEEMHDDASKYNDHFLLHIIKTNTIQVFRANNVISPTSPCIFEQRNYTYYFACQYAPHR